MNEYKYYHVIVRYNIIQQTATGKEQIVVKRDQYLVNAQSITSAEKTITSVLGSLYDNFEIISIKQSTIKGVITQVKDVLVDDK